MKINQPECIIRRFISIQVYQEIISKKLINPKCRPDPTR